MTTDQPHAVVLGSDDYAAFAGSRLLEAQRVALREQAVQSRADKELEHRVTLAKRGQNFGLAALALILSTVITLALTHHDWVAGCVGVPGVFSIIGVFVTGKYQTSASNTSTTSSSGSESSRPTTPTAHS